MHTRSLPAKAGNDGYAGTLHDIMMKYWIVMLLSLIYGCGNPDKIDGHWHIYGSEGRRHYYNTIDIKDTIAILYKSKYRENWEFIIDRKKEKMIIPINEIYGEYDYQLKNDSLIFIMDEYGERLIGLKPEEENCNYEMDFFGPGNIHIQLPILENRLPEIKNKNFLFEILVGPLKTSRDGVDLISIQIAGSNIIKLDELELANLKHEIKVPENHRDLIPVLIYADKEVPIIDLAKILKQQKEINSRKTYLVCRLDTDLRQELTLTYYPIDELPVTSKTETVMEWLQKRD